MKDWLDIFSYLLETVFIFRTVIHDTWNRNAVQSGFLRTIRSQHETTLNQHGINIKTMLCARLSYRMLFIYLFLFYYKFMRETLCRFDVSATSVWHQVTLSDVRRQNEFMCPLEFVVWSVSEIMVYWYSQCFDTNSTNLNNFRDFPPALIDIGSLVKLVKTSLGANTFRVRVESCWNGRQKWFIDWLPLEVFYIVKWFNMATFPLGTLFSGIQRLNIYSVFMQHLVAVFVLVVNDLI